MQFLYIAASVLGASLITGLIVSILLVNFQSYKQKVMWSNGESIAIVNIFGKYRVTMYPRWAWWWLKDIKLFTGKYGMNIAFGCVAWGQRITIEYSRAWTLLNYCKCRWPWRSIRDYLRCMEEKPGDFIGKFKISLPVGWKLQIAWFTMEKIDENI